MLCLVLLGFYLVLPYLTKFDSCLLSFTEFYLVLRVFLVLLGFYLVLQIFIEFSLVLLGFMGFYLILLG